MWVMVIESVKPIHYRLVKRQSGTRSKTIVIRLTGAGVDIDDVVTVEQVVNLDEETHRVTAA